MDTTHEPLLIRDAASGDDAPTDMPGAERVSLRVLIGREHGAPTFSMRRITVEPGGHTPRHAHDYEHEVVVLSGEGTVLLLGEERPIAAGDVLYVPANTEHQFKPTGGDPLRFICLVPGATDCGEPTPGA